MTTDMIIACIIAGLFFLFMICVFVHDIVQEWLRDIYVKNPYVMPEK